jgi:hypothetical protein
MISATKYALKKQKRGGDEKQRKQLQTTNEAVLKFFLTKNKKGKNDV